MGGVGPTAPPPPPGLAVAEVERCRSGEEARRKMKWMISAVQKQIYFVLSVLIQTQPNFVRVKRIVLK